MPEENLTNQSVNLVESDDSDIFAIPDEFYGGVVKKVSTPSVSKPSAAKLVSSVTKPAAAPGGEPISSKWIIIGFAIFLVLGVSGFAYYYIHQAQVAREKINQATAPTPVVENQQPTFVAPAPVAEVPVVATTTPVVTPAVSATSLAIFPFRDYVSTQDTDKDGLTDVEEIIYGTNPTKPDTDSDGFLDGQEVMSLYNPLGFKPVRLLDSGKVKVYLNPTYNYSIYYPGLWVVQALDPNNEAVIFSADTGEFIEVSVVENPLKLSVIDWYLAQAQGVKATDLKLVQTKEKIDGIISPDGLVAYLPFENKIYVINYNIGLKTDINFLSTFKMMVNSFRVHGSLELEVGPAVSTTSTVSTSTIL